MNGRKISTALTALPEDMVAEAMEPGQRGRSFSWLRLAACLAIIVGLCFGFWPADSEIVTAPGLLTVTVYAMDNNEYSSVRLEEGVACGFGTGWNPAISRYPGLPIRFSVNTDEFPAEEITFEISVTEGTYLDWGDHTGNQIIDLPNMFTRENYTSIYWSIDFEDDVYASSYDHIYTYIVIKCEGHIVGYAVLRFDRRYDEKYGASLTYDPFYVASVMFPKVNGMYQNITKEYVENEFAIKE